MLRALFLFILFVPWMCLAEYRVFLLKIAKKNPTPEGQESFKLVQSTLDPVQYPYYYPVQPDEVVTYIDTWRCFGRTSDFKELCPNPKNTPPQAPETPQNNNP